MMTEQTDVLQIRKLCRICNVSPTINKHPNSKYCRACGNKKKSLACKEVQMRDPDAYRAYQREYQKNYKQRKRVV